MYLVNIILNVTAVDIVKSYKDNVDEDIDYDSMLCKYKPASRICKELSRFIDLFNFTIEYNLLTINYICLTFGVVTILLSTAFLVKFSEVSLKYDTSSSNNYIPICTIANQRLFVFSLESVRRLRELYGEMERHKMLFYFCCNYLRRY